MKKIEVNSFERVLEVKKLEGTFQVMTSQEVYEADYVILATGYYDHPNKMDILGEDLPNVFHYFKEAHPYFQQDVIVIGGKNSAVDAALELERAGANVTVVYRGDTYSESVKPWILPAFDSLVKNDIITMHFNSTVSEIRADRMLIEKNGEQIVIPHDFVFAMTGYHPDYSLLKAIGVEIEQESGRPEFNEETMETNIKDLYIAGVIAAGKNTNEIFIENGRFHGGLIANSITGKKQSCMTI